MIAGVVLMARDVAGLADFYCAGLGFRRIGDGGPLALGAQRVVLEAATGVDYPRPWASNDPWFQHMAIVVDDMAAAHRRALAAGAIAVSLGGPQVLPASSGGVTAWKFRDPDGHPLELLAFPAGGAPACWRGEGALFRGIDHTAIVVAHTARSEAFYRRLGFERSGGSVNVGAAQAALDGLEAPEVVVTALSVPGQAAPHLELLEYRAPPGVGAGRWALGDVVATRVLVAGVDGVVRDPDGHVVDDGKKR